MRNALKVTLGLVLALVLAVVGGGALWFGGVWLVEWFGGLEAPTRTGLLALFGVLSVPLISFATQHFLSNRQSREQAIREKRTEFYDKVLEVFISMMSASKTGKNVAPEKHAKTFDSLIPPMLTYASPKFIRAWNLFRTVSRVTTAEQEKKATGLAYDDLMTDNPYLLMASMEQIVVAVRQDLGHRVSSKRYGDLISVIVNDLDLEGLRAAQVVLKDKFPNA